MAAYRTLEVTLISAKDLNEVNLFSKMDVYAIVSLAGEPRSAQRTPTDKDGGKNPSWKNATVRFSIPVDVAAASRLVVHVALRSERSLGDREIGELHIPLNEFFGDGGDKSSSQFVSYQVRKPNSGKPKGVLNLSYKFCEPPASADNANAASAPPAPVGYPAPGSSATAYPPPGKDSKVGEPVTAYPAPGSSASAYSAPGNDSKVGQPATAYPPAGAQGAYPPPYGAPPQYGYSGRPAGYGYPPPTQYGYAPPPAGYGYPPPPAPQYGYAAAAPPKKNKFGAGLGAGLLGGAIGGLLLGEMVSDASEYDAGYDAGFDDAGGFDF
ncbi:protein SRC2-like [Zingiber officinale]|uniref:C2 domain-containing protein n=1 Tax=Zingiber officinale TaxID=94328 RepID=A0A8J5GY23_ZINOF|nr:protein SRC2-like [Zingiber officinale]KAG6515217.1 hypothetical protein ZIOFF_025602 [Zingiber officinale]